MFPNELEENESLSLICSSDVGSPHGYIKIWKISRNSDEPSLIYTSNSSSVKTENCTEFINVTTTYTVTREDNGALFRCSSQNKLTRGPGPSKESSKITVICMYKYLNSMILHYFVLCSWNSNMLSNMFVHNVISWIHFKMLPLHVFQWSTCIYTLYIVIHLSSLRYKMKVMDIN